MLDPIYTGMTDDLVLGEGVLIAGMTAETLLASGDAAALLSTLGSDMLLGATKAGTCFRCQPGLIHTEARGRRTPCAAATLNGPWQATLTGTLMALSPHNAARLLNLAPPAGGSPVTLAADSSAAPVTPACLLFIGSTASGLVLIEMKNPVSTGGLQLHTMPGGAAEVPFTLLARQDGPEDSALPCRILWLKEGGA